MVTTRHHRGLYDSRYYTEAELNSIIAPSGASLIGVEDAGGFFVGADVEAILQEIPGVILPGAYLRLDGTNVPTANYNWTTNLITTGILQGGTITDGTATLTGGAWTGATYNGLTITSGANTFTLTRGTTDLIVSADCSINQDLSNVSSPTFSSLTITNNLTIGGTVDGVDISGFRTTYDAHDHSAADPTQVSHANLTNVTSDQHHAQAHNAASHSDITSTGAQIDDAVSKKHDRQHALNSAADHTGSITDAQHGIRTTANAHAHGHLSGVTSDQHHPQAHTLASHSTKAHTELTGVTANQHHAQSHTIASHSDTTATGAELETLTDDSMADALHRHSELSASDGTPDQALIVDVDGNVGIGIAVPSEKLEIAGNILLSEGANRSISVGAETDVDGRDLTITAGGTSTFFGTGGDLILNGGAKGELGSYGDVSFQTIGTGGINMNQNVNMNSKYIEHLALTPGLDHHAASKKYVDDNDFQMPVGSIIMYGAAAAPTGWLLCNGAEVSRTTYVALFGVIGETFGVGDEETTFNVPDMRGIFPRGAGVSGKLSNANGAAFAGVLGTYQNDKMQGHYHYTRWKNHPDTLVNAGGISAGAAISASGTVDHAGALQAKDMIADGTNGTPRTGTETNPANLGLTFIIKY